MSSTFEYNQTVLDNPQIEDASILDRLIDSSSARQAHLKKEKAKIDKRVSLKEAVQEFVQDGDIYSDSGFSYVRTPLQALFEVMRQNKKNLQGIGLPNTNHSYGVSCGKFAHSRNSCLCAEIRNKHIKEAAIPFIFVDAIVELPYGAAPGNCPDHYCWSREFWEWGIRITLAGKSDAARDVFWDY